MHPSQDEGGASLPGHGGDGVRHLPQGVAVQHDLFGGGGVVAPLQIFLGLDGDDPRAPDVAHDQGVGGLEDVGARMLDVIDGLAGGQGGIGLLDDVVDIDAQAPLRGQPGAQSGFMRQHAPQEPPGPVWIDSKHPHVHSCGGGVYRPSLKVL